jgi:hypothetical protein
MFLKDAIKKNRWLYPLSKAAMAMAIDVKARFNGRPRARIPWNLRGA